MDADAVAELLDIVRGVKAQLEWHAATGSLGLPRGQLADTQPALVEGAAPETVGGASAIASAPAREREGAAVAPASVPRPTASVGPALVSGPAAAPAPALTPADPEGRRLRLLTLNEEVRACTRCGLHAERKQAVFARGTGSSRLCFVGEGPGADEDAQGFPFVGAAGQLLDRMIVAMGLDRDEVYVCNIVKCRPPKNRKPEPEEMAACVPYLHEQIALIEPEAIIALGATAVQGLLGTSEGITRLRGKWKLYQGRIPVMPTFHPAYLLRTPEAKRDVWDDLQAVLKQVGRSLPERRR